MRDGVTISNLTSLVVFVLLIFVISFEGIVPIHSTATRTKHGNLIIKPVGENVVVLCI